MNKKRDATTRNPVLLLLCKLEGGGLLFSTETRCTTLLFTYLLCEIQLGKYTYCLISTAP